MTKEEKLVKGKQKTRPVSVSEILKAGGKLIRKGKIYKIE